MFMRLGSELRFGRGKTPHIHAGLRILVALVVLGWVGVRLVVAGEGALFVSHFENAPEGEALKDVVPINGTFVVKSFEGKKVLEIPGDPVDGYGMLFGPDGLTEATVSARVYATSTGKRMPEFGVGLGDTAGYRLWVMPMTGELQIVKGDDVVAKVSYAGWKSGEWMNLKFGVEVRGGKILLEGKAWGVKDAEPSSWMVHVQENGEAVKGRASIWGSTYSSTPIRFDGLVVGKT
jgi:hypothetical protein